MIHLPLVKPSAASLNQLRALASTVEQSAWQLAMSIAFHCPSVSLNVSIKRPRLYRAGSRKFSYSQRSAEGKRTQAEKGSETLLVIVTVTTSPPCNAIDPDGAYALLVPAEPHACLCSFKGFMQGHYIPFLEASDLTSIPLVRSSSGHDISYSERNALSPGASRTAFVKLVKTPLARIELLAYGPG
jgi:hypothetical protein